MQEDEGYFTSEEQAIYRSMLKENSQPTGIFINDFYKETNPEIYGLSRVIVSFNIKISVFNKK